MSTPMSFVTTPNITKKTVNKPAPRKGAATSKSARVADLWTGRLTQPTAEPPVEARITIDGVRYSAFGELLDHIRTLLAGHPENLAPDKDTLISPSKAADVLGVSRQTIYHWQDHGMLGRVQTGNRRMIPIVDVDRAHQARTEAFGLLAAIAALPEDPEDTFEPPEQPYEHSGFRYEFGAKLEG